MANLFSIQAVARRTGLSPHVIRAWERRYHAITPERSDGKHRLYSDAEIERLAMLQQAVRSGYGIGKIAQLSAEELRRLITQPIVPTRDTETSGTDDAYTQFQKTALAAVTHFDGHSLQSTLRGALLAFGHMGLLQRAVAPLAQEIGKRWRSGTLTAAHEHFFTAAVKIFLGHSTRQFSTSTEAPVIVVTTPAGQLHELGAVMAAAAAANLGWRSIYLGPSLPAHEIAGAVRRNKAAAVALSIVYPEDDSHLASELESLAALVPAGTRLLAGGRAALSYFSTLIRIGALYAGSIEEFAAQLDTLRKAGTSSAT